MKHSKDLSGKVVRLRGRNRLSGCLRGCGWLLGPVMVAALVLGAFLFLPLG